MLEVEQKYWIDNLESLEQRLRELAATAGPIEQHADEYFNHPTRDFAETKEALRIRRVDGVAHITYKAPKLPGAVKAREEMEWCLSPGDADGSLTSRLWLTLGFRSVAVVKKTRRTYSCPSLGGDLSITIDKVVGVGLLAEVEVVIDDPAEVEAARRRVEVAAKQLRLHRVEPRSYLGLLLAEGIKPVILT